MRRGHPPSGDDSGPLRARAEERLRAREAAASLRPGDEADALRLLHELQVHQIELELQNAELARARDELEAALERYTDLYDFAPVGYLTLARDGGIYSANLAGADLLGVPRARLLGRRLGTFLPLAERPSFDAFLARTLDDTERTSCEVTLAPDGGGKRVVRIEATASPSGKECRAALLDVTAQRSAEAEVRRVNEGLEAAVRKPAPQPGAGPALAAVDLAGPCREILDALAAGSPHRKVETVLPGQILVRGDARLLRLLLENLLGNAWKFTANTPAARIEVGLRPVAGGGLDLTVRDNGAGFDGTCAGRLFRPFQRLHPEEEYPGAGLGLAIVAMIAERHGGSVSAEGTAGAGATFHVRLPAPETRLG